MTTMAKKITINDVADAAGVSVTTVSLVLSGKGRISAATGTRVNEAIEKLGFVRNRQAASLRGGQSGIIIAGAAGQGTELREAAEQKNLPLVFASRASYLDEVDIIRPDNMQAAQLVTEHLIKRGHQRIAWIGGRGSSLTRAERLGGYCSTLLKFGLPFHSEWIIECESSQKLAADAITTLLHQNPTITAVLCHNNTIAMGAWFGLLRAGRQSGEGSIESYFDRHVALAAFAEVMDEELDDLPLTWVSTPAREIGRSAGQRILARAKNGDDEMRNQIMPARLVAWKS